MYAENDVDVCWNNFCTAFISIMDQYLPYKNIKFGENYPEWAESHFLSSDNERDRAINKAYERKTDVSIANAKRLQNMKRNFKRLFWAGF